MKHQIQLSDHFTYSRLLRFTAPSIGMMIFTSVYGVVDGFFISNFVGKTAFAAVNLIMPYLTIIGGVGAMLGVGGSALVAKTLGEKKELRACQYFTMMIELMAISAVILAAVGIAVLRPVGFLFGASDDMIGDVITYGTICLLFSLGMHGQWTFQSYLIVAEQPKLAFAVVVAAGVCNMALDFLFMAVFRWGVAGAALATGISQLVGGGLPFIWFLSRKNSSSLRFVKTKLELRPILHACFNGVSEMLSSVSASITGILYNWQLMRFAGEDGVAAYGVVMYAAFIFIAVFAGYSQGASPIMGYHYGAQNHDEMKNVLRRSMTLLGAAAVILTALAILLARPLSALFVGYDAHLLEMTVHAFIICATPFLIMWFNIYTSSFFTALNDGPVSAAISFMRALALPVICILVLPMLFELNGVWYSLVASDVLSVGVSLFFLLRKKKKYGY